MCKCIITLIILHFNPNLSMQQAVNWSEWIKVGAQRRNIPVSLVLAVFVEESRFQPRAVSRACAIGLGQVLVYDCKSVKRIAKLKNPAYNIYESLRIMKNKRKRCATGKSPPRHCRPHWIQAYNPHGRGYGRMVLKRQRRIERYVRKVKKLLHLSPQSQQCIHGC